MAHSFELPPDSAHDMVTLAAPASVLPAPRSLLAESASDQRCVWLAPTFSVLPPLNATVSTTSSPEAEDTVTLGALVVPWAVAAVPSGVVWCTPVNVIAPTLNPSLLPLSVTTTSPAAEAGAISLQISDLTWLLESRRAATSVSDRGDTPPKVTELTCREPDPSNNDTPTRRRRSEPPRECARSWR